MTMTEQILTIAVVMFGTMFTRFISFFVFPQSKTPPKYIQYLGTVLPYAVMGLLVIYCLKDAFTGTFHGLPEAIAILAVVLVHKWKKNMLLSIMTGTLLYMFLVQVIF